MKLIVEIFASVLIALIFLISTIYTETNFVTSTDIVFINNNNVNENKEKSERVVISADNTLSSRLYDFRALHFKHQEVIPSDKVREAVNAIKIFIAERIYDVSTIVEKLSTGVYRVASTFATDTLQLFLIVRDNVMDIIKIIATKILQIDDETVKEFFENVKNILEKVVKLFTNLLNHGEKEFANILNHVNNTLMAVSEDMEMWSRGIKMKLRSIKDDDHYKKGCEYIDNFVKSNIEDAYECCNIAIKPMRSICNNFKDVIGDTLNILVDIIEKVEICILEKKARVHVMIACLDDAYDKVIELMKHVSDLKDSLFKTLPTKIMISNFCFSMAAVSVEVRKIDISNEIDKKYLN